MLQTLLIWKLHTLKIFPIQILIPIKSCMYYSFTPPTVYKGSCWDIVWCVCPPRAIRSNFLRSRKGTFVDRNYDLTAILIKAFTVLCKKQPFGIVCCALYTRSANQVWEWVASFNVLDPLSGNNKYEPWRRVQLLMNNIQSVPRVIESKSC